MLILIGIQPQAPDGMLISARRSPAACAASSGVGGAGDGSGGWSPIAAMIGKTLALYFARQFTMLVIGVFSSSSA